MENQKNINENKDGTHIRNLILETFTKFGDEILSSNVIKIRKPHSPCLWCGKESTFGYFCSAYCMQLYCNEKGRV